MGHDGGVVAARARISTALAIANGCLGGKVKAMLNLRAII